MSAKLWVVTYRCINIVWSIWFKSTLWIVCGCVCRIRLSNRISWSRWLMNLQMRKSLLMMMRLVTGSKAVTRMWQNPRKWWWCCCLHWIYIADSSVWAILSSGRSIYVFLRLGTIPCIIRRWLLLTEIICLTHCILDMQLSYEVDRNCSLSSLSLPFIFIFIFIKIKIKINIEQM